MQNSTGNPHPICRIFNNELKIWQPFHTFSLTIQGQQLIFHYQNTQSIASNHIQKSITHDYIAYFSRIIPSAVYSPAKEAKKSTSSPSKLKNELCPEEINCMLVLEDLTLRYSPIIHEDQYIILGFQVANPNLNENNHELKYIRDIISDLHFQLKFSKAGIIYQVTERINTILFKTVKYSLTSLAELFNVHPSLQTLDKLKFLQKMCNDIAFKDYLEQIVHSPDFYQELVSLTYKTIIDIGLLPFYIELNTMNEMAFWLKIKDLIANPTAAPYGTNHHASFCIGNFRYSYVFEVGNKEKQRISVSMEDKRGFSFKNRAFQYFRIKFLDFFPLDTWVERLATEAKRIVQTYLKKTSHIVLESNDDGYALKEYLEHLVETGDSSPQHAGLKHKIAQEFYQAYYPELDSSMNDGMFNRITQLMTNSELKGYSNFTNNCQTIVAEILAIFTKQFSSYMTPVVVKDTQTPNKKPNSSEESKLQGMGAEQMMEKVQEIYETKKNLLDFGSQFNYKFKYVGPFSLTNKLAYFNIFVDKDTLDLLSPSNFGSLHERIKDYYNKEHIKTFLARLEKGLQVYTKQYKEGCVKSRSSLSFSTTDDPVKRVKLDLEGEFALISCLVHLKYNELFSLRREIKLANYCKEKLEDNKADHKTVIPVSFSVPKERSPKGEAKEWLAMANKLPELYSKKYKLISVLRELQYYFYNNIRFAFRKKFDGKVAYLGPLIIREPGPIMKKEVLRKQSNEQSEIDSDKEILSFVFDETSSTLLQKASETSQTC